MSTAFINDFQHEYDLAQMRRLRDQVAVYCAVSIVFGFLGVVFNVLLMEQLGPTIARVASNLFFIAAFVALFVHGKRTTHTRQSLLTRVSQAIIITSVVSTLVTTVLIFFEGRLDRVITFGFTQLISLFLTHFVACCCLPWTWKESLRPMIPAVVTTVLCILVIGIITASELSLWTVIGYVAYLCLCVMVVLPGLGITIWKAYRFDREFMLRNLGGRYGEMRRELSGAQRIHESLFPKPDQRGHLKFDYRYQPMRAIGGDYLYARFITTDDREEPQLLTLLLDVTGHGIPAALTVNRLYGELERLVGEQPGIMPTDILRALNRYTYLTLSDYSLFVTAICFRVDTARGVLHYANAGHPPAYLREISGKIIDLEPTAMVLGVARDLDVEVVDPRLPFHDGDSLIAYTDGAIEIRDTHGRMFNDEGLRAAVRSCETAAGASTGVGMCDHIMRRINGFRFGPPTDDTLIVEITRLYTNEEASLEQPRVNDLDESRAGASA